MINSNALFLKIIQLKHIPIKLSFSSSIIKKHYTQSNKNDEKSIPHIKEAILNKAIEFVSESGWSKDTIVRATKSLDYPPHMHGIIDEGEMELIYYFYETRTNLMSEYLDKLLKSTDPKDINTRIILYEGIKNRLSLIEPVLHKWPEAIAKMSYPTNLSKTGWMFRNLLDELWIKAGDKSTNMSWYSKRAVVGAVYSSSEMFMLQDKSQGHIETWQFLDRRLNDAESIGHFGMIAKDFIKNSKETCDTISTLFLNVTGLYRK